MIDEDREQLLAQNRAFFRNLKAVAAPKSLQRPEVACSEWVEEAEAALRRILNRGQDCRCNGYLGPCGCGQACAEIASEALENKPEASSTGGLQRPRE